MYRFEVIVVVFLYFFASIVGEGTMMVDCIHFDVIVAFFEL